MLGDGDDGTVTCIACGRELPRTDAREYDKEGNRWDREEKTFEFLCKPCDSDRSHQPRAGLETTLADSGAGEVDRAVFLRRLCSALEDRTAEEQ